jgi:hypothetical protein
MKNFITTDAHMLQCEIAAVNSTQSYNDGPIDGNFILIATHIRRKCGVVV